MAMLGMLIVVIVGLTCMTSSASERQDVHALMYDTFSGAAGCFRRMNGTHQFGCSSPRKGSFGVIQLVDTPDELQFLIESAAAGPYMVVLSPFMMSPDVINRLKSVPEKISGIVFTDRHLGERKFPTSYSPFDVCPNAAQSSCVKEHPWNPYGNNYLFTDWSVPLFLVTDKSNYTNIVECYTKFNLPLDETQEGRPLCSLHMKSHMFAAVSSKVCTRRINNNFVSTAKFCDPIGSENVVVPLKATGSRKKGVIVISSQIDSASLFDGVAPGAMSAVTGIVTTLTTASLIYDYVQTTKSTKDVLFVLFNGEAFEYIGSSRVLYDMKRGEFVTKANPIGLEDIDLFIDISQIGMLKGDSDSSIFIHASGSRAQDFSKQLISKGTSYNATYIPSSITELPPTSFSTFHKAAKLNGIVLTNYNTTFKTKYYGGYYDTYETLGYTYLNGSVPEDTSIQSHIAGVSLSLAQTVLMNIADYKEIPIDFNELAKKVDSILYCYLVSRSCQYLEDVYPALAADSKLPQVLPLYVGVPQATNHVTKATGLLLSYFTSPKVNISKTDCVSDDPNNEFSLLWLGGKGVCLNTTLKFTPAVSPAFIIEDYDWASGQYPTWTESVWDENSLGIFLKPSRQSELKVLFTGIFTFVIMFIGIFFIKKKSNYLFVPVYPTNC